MTSPARTLDVTAKLRADVVNGSRSVEPVASPGIFRYAPMAAKIRIAAK
jgi:hypothetical protein